MSRELMWKSMDCALGCGREETGAIFINEINGDISIIPLYRKDMLKIIWMMLKLFIRSLI